MTHLSIIILVIGAYVFGYVFGYIGRINRKHDYNSYVRLKDRMKKRMKKSKPDTLCSRVNNCGNCWWFIRDSPYCLNIKSGRMGVDALSKPCKYIIPLKSCMNCIVCNGHKYGFK